MNFENTGIICRNIRTLAFTLVLLQILVCPFSGTLCAELIPMPGAPASVPTVPAVPNSTAPAPSNTASTISPFSVPAIAAALTAAAGLANSYLSSSSSSGLKAPPPKVEDVKDANGNIIGTKITTYYWTGLTRSVSTETSRVQLGGDVLKFSDYHEYYEDGKTEKMNKSSQQTFSNGVLTHEFSFNLQFDPQGVATYRHYYTYQAQAGWTFKVYPQGDGKGKPIVTYEWRPGWASIKMTTVIQ